MITSNKLNKFMQVWLFRVHTSVSLCYKLQTNNLSTSTCLVLHVGMTRTHNSTWVLYCAQLAASCMGSLAESEYPIMTSCVLPSRVPMEDGMPISWYIMTAAPWRSSRVSKSGTTGARCGCRRERSRTRWRRHADAWADHEHAMKSIRVRISGFVIRLI